MKLFLSWSGKQSRSIAECLRDWLPFVINAAEPWMSASDIDAGVRWNNALQRQLEETHFGILCVTPSNTAAPWLLFEAGALAKTIQDTYVCPYLHQLNPSDLVSGPLTQFQAKTATKDGTFELVQSVNRAMASDGLPDERLGIAFERWWPDLEQKLTAIKPDESGPPPTRSVDEILAETLALVRRMDQTISNFPHFNSSSQLSTTQPELTTPEQVELNYKAARENTTVIDIGSADS